MLVSYPKCNWGQEAFDYSLYSCETMSTQHGSEQSGRVYVLSCHISLRALMYPRGGVAIVREPEDRWLANFMSQIAFLRHKHRGHIVMDVVGTFAVMFVGQ